MALDPDAAKNPGALSGAAASAGLAHPARRLSLVAAALFLATAAAAAEPEWQKLTPPDSGLTVEVPGPSVLNADNSDPTLIAGSRSYAIGPIADGTDFRVMIVDFRPDSRENMSDDQYYTVGVDMVGGCQLQGYAYVSGDDPASGRAATYRCMGDRTARAEFHLKDLRLYGLVAGGPGEAPQGEAAKRFFSSFKAD